MTKVLAVAADRETRVAETTGLGGVIWEKRFLDPRVLARVDQGLEITGVPAFLDASPPIVDESMILRRRPYSGMQRSSVELDV